MTGDQVAVIDVAPRRTAVIADTVAWEDFPQLWAPMLDEVYGHPDAGGGVDTEVFHLLA